MNSVHAPTSTYNYKKVYLNLEFRVVVQFGSINETKVTRDCSISCSSPSSDPLLLPHAPKDSSIEILLSPSLKTSRHHCRIIVIAIFCCRRPRRYLDAVEVKVIVIFFLAPATPTPTSTSFYPLLSHSSVVVLGAIYT